MKVHEVNKLMNLAQRIAEALEKIAKELEQPIGLNPAVVPNENITPLDWHSGRNR